MFRKLIGKVGTFTAAVAMMVIVGCGQMEHRDDLESKQMPFTSHRATLLTFEFDGELLTNSTWNLTSQVERQMLYTVGQLNGEDSVGRLDKLEITQIHTAPAGDGLTLVSYHAVLPVGWGTKTDLPDSYILSLPLRVDWTGEQQFTDKYKDTCVSWGAHDVTVGSMWYYYRPKAYGCELDEADVARLNATVTVSDENTTGKYPEYHKIWQDDVLEVVAVFGKNDSGQTSNSDAGISAYNTFLRLMQEELGQGVATVPEDVPANPGVQVPDVTFTKEYDDGRRVQVVVILIDGVRSAGPEFDSRYESLTPTADVVMYFGHSGLGANIRALARKGRFESGQYQIFFMHGCDTFAYVDSAISDAKKALNPDDPSGTKYLDMLTNVMPAFFSSNAPNGQVLVHALLAVDDPKTYEDIFADIDSYQVVVATGEEDNVYYPGYEEQWPGVTYGGAVGQGEEFRYETPSLAAGRYRFKISEDPANPGGDADLYLRADAQPTTTEWDCRPYLSGSEETCTVTLAQEAVIHVMVRGWSNRDNFFILDGAKLEESQWGGLHASGTVLQDHEDYYETEILPAGHYEFELSGTADADLYVRVGSQPTTSEWDCRPFSSTSNELCTIETEAEAKIHIMVRGWAATSTYELNGR